ncbi:MAG: 4Fe-4S dicluster domain-containing protein [Nitrospirae bacterium]|nr:4Fe-4S dicluster domain-containing protein [Nitrospirota bacterium]
MPENITKPIRVIDLRLCLLCNTCEKSCAGRHCFQRNVRNGVRIGHFILPYACKQCDEPQCIKSCKKGAVKRDDASGVLYLDKNVCVGCGLCAKKCPFNSISIVEAGSKGDSEKPAKYANRCDLCRGYQKKGCFTNCPSGALKLLPFNMVYLSLPSLYKKKLAALFLIGCWLAENNEEYTENNMMQANAV